MDFNASDPRLVHDLLTKVQELQRELNAGKERYEEERRAHEADTEYYKRKLSELEALRYGDVEVKRVGGRCEVVFDE